MRIQYPENLRVPLQGSSVGGESGPKMRPKGVIDGKQVNIPVLYLNWVPRDEVTKFKLLGYLKRNRKQDG